jgi:hypothetical protein
MFVLCSECGYRLRAKPGSIGAFGAGEFFDDRVGSATYGEQVLRCPGCDLWLYYSVGIETSEAINAGSE